jgi:hypothetical protein
LQLAENEVLDFLPNLYQNNTFYPVMGIDLILLLLHSGHREGIQVFLLALEYNDAYQ